MVIFILVAVIIQRCTAVALLFRCYQSQFRLDTKFVKHPVGDDQLAKSSFAFWTLIDQKTSIFFLNHTFNL